MQTYTRKTLRSAGVMLLLLVGLIVSQVIFSVLYDPYASSHIFIPGGQRAQIITTKGYKKLYTRSYDQTRPSLITDRLGEDFQQKCRYGIGQCGLFAHQELLASIYWIDLIQYIGKKIEPGKANTITNRIHRINTLSPKRSYPYIFGALMGPNIQTNNKKNDDLTTIMSQNAITIGEEGIRMTCNMKKVEAIKHLPASTFISVIKTKDPHYREPCLDYRLPQMLAFDYYHYIQDYEKAIIYYKITAMHDDVPSIAISMPDIIAKQYGIVMLYK